MKTAIIIQGPLTYKDRIISVYEKYKENIVISSWDTENFDGFENWKVVKTNRNFPSGVGNINLQTVSTINGISYAKKTGFSHVLKMRSDMFPSNVETFLGVLNVFSLTDDNKLAFLCWHEHNGGYLVDYLNYGNIENMQKFWDITSDEQSFAERILTDSYYGKDNVYDDIKQKAYFMLPELVRCNVKLDWVKYGKEVTDYIQYDCYKHT